MIKWGRVRFRRKTAAMMKSAQRFCSEKLRKIWGRRRLTRPNHNIADCSRGPEDGASRKSPTQDFEDLKRGSPGSRQLDGNGHATHACTPGRCQCWVPSLRHVPPASPSPKMLPRRAIGQLTAPPLRHQPPRPRLVPRRSHQAMRGFGAGTVARATSDLRLNICVLFMPRNCAELARPRMPGAIRAAPIRRSTLLRCEVACARPSRVAGRLGRLNTESA